MLLSIDARSLRLTILEEGEQSGQENADSIHGLLLLAACKIEAHQTWWTL